MTWIKRYRETGTVEQIYTPQKDTGRNRKTSVEQDNLIFDYICGIPVDEAKLARVSVGYTTLRKRVNEKYEEMCLSAEDFPVEQREAVEDFL